MRKVNRAISTGPRAIALILALGFLCCALWAQDAGPAKELLQWVGDARKAGLTDQQIQNYAASAGWQEDAVNEALRATAGKAGNAETKPEPAPAKQAGDAPKISQPAPANAAGDQPASAGHENTAPAADAGVNGPPAGNVPLAPTAPAAEAGSKGLAGSASSPAEPGASMTKPVVDRGVPDDYQIGAGDDLHIAVWHEPDATVADAVVRPDGKISIPLLKEVAVLGLTPSQLEKEITQGLTKFFAAPDVTVIVKAINSKKIYAIGAVKKEGPIPYTYRMSVLQALSEAGGLTDYAKRKKIYVLRTENGREFRLPFDYDAVLKGQHMELNILLMAGDVVVVPH